MHKIDDIKHRLSSDPDGMMCWLDGGYLPTASYESAEVTGIQISLMLDGHEDVYVITILPGDDYGAYDAWLRRMGSTDMVHIPPVIGFTIKIEKPLKVNFRPYRHFVDAGEIYFPMFSHIGGDIKNRRQI